MSSPNLGTRPKTMENVRAGQAPKAAGQNVPGSHPVLEINPSHPIVKRLRAETDEARFADWSHILFDQAMLAEGGQLEDPASFVRRLNELMLTLAGEGSSKIWLPGQ